MISSASLPLPDRHHWKSVKGGFNGLGHPPAPGSQLHRGVWVSATALFAAALFVAWLYRPGVVPLVGAGAERGRV